MAQHTPDSAERRGRIGDQMRRLLLILALTVSFMGVELVGGWLSGSLALLADAGHMLSDSMAIALSLFAVWLMGMETSAKRTFGFRRAEILAAFINAMGLVAVALWIVLEAVERLGQPRQVEDGILLVVALAGLAVNLVALGLLRRHARHNLTIRSAVWHITGDLLGSLGTIVAALVIRFTGWMPIDSLIGIGIALLVGAGGFRILYDSTNILLDSVPKELDPQAVSRYLESVPNVSQVCDLHIWGVSSTEAVLTAHLVIEGTVDRDSLLSQLLGDLKTRFGLAHMTIQLENTPQETCHSEW